MIFLSAFHCCSWLSPGSWVSFAFFPAVGKALEVTPENGMILVFGDSGTHNPYAWQNHLHTSKRKKIKIFWIYTPCCWGMCDKVSLEAYRGLSEGRVYNTMSELNINQFFTAAVHTVASSILALASVNYIQWLSLQLQVQTPCETHSTNEASGFLSFPIFQGVRDWETSKFSALPHNGSDYSDYTTNCPAPVLGK